MVAYGKTNSGLIPVYRADLTAALDMWFAFVCQQHMQLFFYGFLIWFWVFPTLFGSIDDTFVQKFSEKLKTSSACLQDWLFSPNCGSAIDAVRKVSRNFQAIPLITNTFSPSACGYIFSLNPVSLQNAGWLWLLVPKPSHVEARLKLRDGAKRPKWAPRAPKWNSHNFFVFIYFQIILAVLCKAITMLIRGKLICEFWGHHCCWKLS